jgi:hypothetical protein
MRCKFCKCTNENACPGGCYWVMKNICSKCWPDCAERIRVSPLCQEKGCKKHAALKTLDRIGPRWYAVYRCPVGHTVKVRINQK